MYDDLMTSMTSARWQHGPARRVTVLLAIAGLAVPACRQAAHELAGGPAGAEAARELVQALADRFGPVDREPVFDSIRPKLATGAMVPSRVFDDPSAWRMRGDDWRAFDLDRYSTGRVYRIGARAEALPARAPGQYRSRVQLRNERLGLLRDASGATLVEQSVRLTPSGLRGFAPHHAAFLDRYSTPMHASATVADLDGVPWW